MEDLRERMKSKRLRIRSYLQKAQPFNSQWANRLCPSAVTAAASGGLPAPASLPRPEIRKNDLAGNSSIAPVVVPKAPAASAPAPSQKSQSTGLLRRQIAQRIGARPFHRIFRRQFRSTARRATNVFFPAKTGFDRVGNPCSAVMITVVHPLTAGRASGKIGFPGPLDDFAGRNILPPKSLE